jgi:hypothetical protein
MTKLHATDRDIAFLVLYAKTANEGNHPTGGNNTADVLDALVAHLEANDPEALYQAAKDMVYVATRMRDFADDELSGNLSA